MGMSASQSRLLTLTARLSDLEYQSQSIENARIRLSQKTEQAATEYANALEKKDLSVISGVDAKTGAYQTVNANAYNLTTYGAVSTIDKQRFLKDSYGKVLVTDGVANAFTASNKDLNTFLSGMGITTDKSNSGYDSAKVAYYTTVFSQMSANGYDAPGNENMYSSDWLYSQLTSGNIHLEEWNSAGGTEGKGAFEEVSWSSGDSSLQSKNDDESAAKAEAVYTAKTAEIQTQDKKLELSLKQIDTEHEAVQTEYDSVKKVIDKNIERSFKTFNA